jgi:DNA replication regulator SLD3
MSTATMDKKYKEAIPSIINTLPADTLAEDDVTTVVAELQKKLRKTKKPKIGKDGLYPGEELNISRWWLSRDAFALGSESQDNAEDSMRASLLELRATETQMQIIFLLEALALEASMPAAQTNNIAPKAASEWENEASHTKKRKVKKPQDLHVLLDLFVDRLCIWQSMRMDDSNLNKAAGAQPRASDHGGIGPDALKNFCVDVVLPL